jgi:hypothetical protein
MGSVRDEIGSTRGKCAWGLIAGRRTRQPLATLLGRHAVDPIKI